MVEPEFRICFICSQPMNKRGKRIDKHHVYGWRRSSLTANVHKKCHIRYHQRKDVYKLKMTLKMWILNRIKKITYKMIQAAFRVDKIVLKAMRKDFSRQVGVKI